MKIFRTWLPAAALFMVPLLAAAQSGDVEEIIVTGSYLKGSPEDAPTPIQTLQRENIVASGASDIAEVVRNLEIASGSDTAPTDGARFNGGAGAGLANVNLRGLGPTSTLVLLDGKRLHEAGQKLSDGDRFVDINMIPITMVERVEVLKTGASALYGSDAIAGVVNFITRSDFEGFEVSMKYQDTTNGTQEDATLGAIFGWGSDNGRTNFVIGGEYFDRGKQNSSDRPDLRRDLYDKQDASIVNRFTFTGGDPACESEGFFRDNAQNSDPNVCNRNGSETGIMIPQQKRASVMATLTHSFSDAIEFYGSVSYMEGESGSNENVYSGPIEPKYFLPTLLGATSGTDFTMIGGAPNDPSVLTNGGPLPPFPIPALGIFLPLELADYTMRTPGLTPQRKYKGQAETENIRYSLGLKGDFELGSKAWSYDASFTRGENTYRTSALEIDKNRLELAMYGLGGPDCSPNGTLDPNDPRAAAARFTLAGTDGQFDTTAPGLGAVGPLEPTFIALSGTVPNFAFINPDNLVMAMTSNNNGDASQGCYFFNPFLSRVDNANPNLTPSDELLRWIEFPMEEYQKTDTYLNSFDLVFAGELFEFNGNMIELAFGGQYREEGRKTAVHEQITGSVNSFGILEGGASVGGLSENRNFDADRNIYGFFAEFMIPLTDTLDMQLAGRYEDYGGSIGDTFDPMLALRWQATDSFVLRGSVASAFRGPAISQVVEGTGFSLEFGVRDLLGEQTRPEGDNCVRTGRCALPDDDVAPVITIVKQGRASPDLKPETAVTWNVGAIWNPTDSSQIGLDYYRIDFEDKIIDVPTQAYLTEEVGRFESTLASGDFVIVDPTAGDFGQSCDPSDSIYDPGTPLAERCQVNPAGYAINEATSEFNGNITRRPDTSRDLQIIASNATNTGKVISQGVDFNFLWTWDMSFGQFLLDSRLNHVISHKVKDFPTGQPDYQAAGYANRGPDRRLSASMPDLKATTGLTFFRDNHFARVGWRYVGSYKDDSVPSLRLVEEFDPYHAIDLSYSYTWNMGNAGDIQLTLGAVDLFDATLPNVRDSRGVDLTVFDQRGRRLYASLLYRI